MNRRPEGPGEPGIEGVPSRRRFPRIRSENPVLVRKLDDENVGAFGSTQVLGLGGCVFESDEVFDAGTLLRMSISVSGRALYIVARVAYATAHGSRAEIGVEFLDADAEDLAIIQDLVGRRPVEKGGE